MIRILVADDEIDMELLIKQRFRRQIRENKYQFVFALNGKQAIQHLQENGDIDLVLSDINMPEMDGLTLLNSLPEINPMIKTVMVSAYGDMDNIRTAMNRGAFDFVCKPVNFQDLELTIEKTIRHIHQLKETIKAIKENNILRMYVDESVLLFMEGKEFEKTLLANETIDATVAFIDICSFTSIMENNNANKVVTLLNQYFDLMVHEIIEQGGHVDKFIGDAVLAVFRGDYHLDRAIEASLALRNRIENLPSEQNGTGFRPNVSIGIHSGEMISGNIGSARLKRLDFTVIGDVVNTAQRLQAAATPGQILIGAASFEKVKASFECRKVGELVLKNKMNPFLAFEVVN
ncbi:response regulator [Flavisolibacter sp. BT320]|nr:response regulator [Flavisolibacter longurius]